MDGGSLDMAMYSLCITMYSLGYYVSKMGHALYNLRYIESGKVDSLIGKLCLRETE